MILHEIPGCVCGCGGGWDEPAARDHRGRGIVPLGPSSMRKLTSGLASILDDAIEDEHIDHHPARGKWMRVHIPKPNRTFLEMDELACVLDAAAKQDRTVDPAVTPRTS